MTAVERCFFTPLFAPALFRYGFVFSLGLTLLPVPLSALGWLTRFFWAARG